jgi:hypothetical protein
VADREAAQGYAERMLAPTVALPGEPTRRELVDAIATAFESIPQAMLEVAEQRGYRLVSVPSGVHLYDLSDRYREQLEEEYGQDTDRWNMEDAGIAGLHSRDERTVYLRRTDEDVVVHEFGHVIDSSLGQGEDPNSIRDTLLIGAYFTGEMLTQYSYVSPMEGWAENFRLWAGVSSDVHDPWPGIPGDVRDWADQRAPVTMAYLDNLSLSLELALQKDSRAFTPGSNFDRDTEVLARTYVATSMGVRSDEVDVDQLRRALDKVRAERDVEPPQDSNPLIDPPRTTSADLSELPIYVPKVNEFVDRREDLVLDVDQSMRVLGRSEDGERVLGRSGAAILSVSRDAFQGAPSVDDGVVITRNAGQETARPAELLQSLER